MHAFGIGFQILNQKMPCMPMNYKIIDTRKEKTYPNFVSTSPLNVCFYWCCVQSIAAVAFVWINFSTRHLSTAIHLVIDCPTSKQSGCVMTPLSWK